MYILCAFLPAHSHLYILFSSARSHLYNFVCTIVCAGGEIDLRDRVLLEHFDHVKKVKTIHNRYGIKGFSKLNAWLMEEYDKVVYIDVDTLVLGNLDHLFEHPEPTAVPDVYMSGKFNSGLLVLKPSKKTFNAMMAKMDVLQSYNKGDQGFLNAFFSGTPATPASSSRAHSLTLDQCMMDSSAYMNSSACIGSVQMDDSACT